jgi:nickel superoxide dismutase
MKILKTISYIVSYLLFTYIGLGHCQIPCGIYDDFSRIEQLHEDAINEFSDQADIQSSQQLIRWVNNKEAHAEAIIQMISNYFLTQRIKPSQEDYDQRLMDHHSVIIQAMKVKQSSSMDAAALLSSSIKKLEQYYE